MKENIRSGINITTKTISYAIGGFISFFILWILFTIILKGDEVVLILFMILAPICTGLGALYGLKKGLQKENEVRGKDEAIEKRQINSTDEISKPSIMELPNFFKPNIQKIVMLLFIIFSLYFLSIVYLNESTFKSGQTQETPQTINNSIGMEFVQIPAGEFYMGSLAGIIHIIPDSGRPVDEGPVHRVKIPQSFYLGKYEVTQKQWRDVMGNNPSYFKGDDLPVENIPWNDVQDFIKKINAKEGVTKYRLPSEAEWEYAARAGTITSYSFGYDESKLGDYAWCNNNDGDKTHEVGKKRPNPWGLYDMYGNVWEWVQDKWHKNYDGAPNDGSAWEIGSSSARVIRGGGWFYPSFNCRSAYRIEYVVDNHVEVIGFRLLRDL